MGAPALAVEDQVALREARIARGEDPAHGAAFQRGAELESALAAVHQPAVRGYLPAVAGGGSTESSRFSTRAVPGRGSGTGVRTQAKSRVLVAVAEHGSFAAAAAGLGLTQSAVSHSVRSVEAKLGAVLFERGRTGASPTPAGERAVGHARRILRLYEVMGAEARGAGRAADPAVLEGVLRIAAFRSAALHLLPPALERLAARHPGLRPEVRVVRELGAGSAWRSSRSCRCERRAKASRSPIWAP
ncbi:HTH-type transcriptional regulator HdfR [Streptomyces avidinii]